LSFDVDWMRGQSVGVFPIHNTTPEPVIAELEKILDSGEAGLSQNLVKLQAVSRMNAVLVVARKPELLQAAGAWIGRLDGSTAGTGVKVYRVRYGDARLLAKLLSDLFIGGSGAGKSTLARLIAGYVRPSSGSVTFAGHDIHAEYASLRSRIGMVPQDDVVHRQLTVNQALGYDMNTCEFAIKDGVPYAIDFTNPAPDFEITSLTDHYFPFTVQKMADLCIDLALGKRQRTQARPQWDALIYQ